MNIFANTTHILLVFLFLKKVFLYPKKRDVHKTHYLIVFTFSSLNRNVNESTYEFTNEDIHLQNSSLDCNECFF